MKIVRKEKYTTHKFILILNEQIKNIVELP